MSGLDFPTAESSHRGKQFELDWGKPLAKTFELVSFPHENDIKGGIYGFRFYHV